MLGRHCIFFIITMMLGHESSLEAGDEIGTFLAQVGLEQLRPVFDEHDIDPDVLTELEDADLREMGLSLGQRKKVLKGVEALRRSLLKSEEHAGDSSVSDDFKVRRLTVMFCDLVGSTRLAQDVQAEELYDVLQAYYKIANEVTRRFDGYIATLQGDGIMVLFGYPKTGGVNAEKAIGAGLAMIEAVHAHKHRLSDGKILTIKARVGIATGSVVMGRTSEGFLTEEVHTVGPTPNLAARLQGTAEPGMVVVDETTRALAGELFEFAAMEDAILKGFDKPVPVARAIRARQSVDRFEALHRSHLPLFGRDAELAMLTDKWSKASTGQGSLVHICGDAGQGKSRLLQEIENTAEGEGGRVLRMRCSPLYAHTPLHPVMDILGQIVGLADASAPAARIEALRHQLRDASDADAALIGELLSIDLLDDDQKVEQMAPAAARTALLKALASWLLGRPDRATLITLEDTQWADPTTLELMATCAALLEEQPGLVIATSRTEAVPVWDNHPRQVLHELKPLDASASDALVGHLMGEHVLPDETLAAVRERGDGNPLLLTEVVKVAEGKGGSDLAFEWSVPASLYDSVLDRIDHLEQGRAVATAATVFGRTAPVACLRLILDIPDDSLEQAIGHLRQAGIFEPGQLGAMDHVQFRHSLVRDTLYEGIVSSRRRELHAAAVDALNAIRPDMADLQPELLAWHNFVAGRFEAAAPLSFKAGERAADRLALNEASHHLEQTLVGIDNQHRDQLTDHLKLQALAALTAVKRSLLGIAAPEVGDRTTELRDLARRLGDRKTEMLALNGLYAFHLVRADFRGAAVWADQLLETARAANDETFEMIGMRAVGAVALHRGDLETAHSYLTQALDRYDADKHGYLATQHGYDHAEICAVFLAFALWMRGDLAAAWRMSDFSISHSEKIAHMPSLAQATAFRALLAALSQDAHQMVENGGRAVEIGQRYALRFLEGGGRLYGQIGHVLLAQGDDARQKLEKLLEYQSDMVAISPDNYAPIGHALIASCMMHVGDLTRAGEHLVNAKVFQQKSGEVWTEPELFRVEARLLEKQGRTADAQAKYRQTLDFAAQKGAWTLALRAAIDLAQLLGDTAESRQIVEQAAAAMTSLDDHWDCRRLQDIRKRFARQSMAS